METTAEVASAVQLLYRLRGLGMAGAVLHIGAHPDDEDSGLLTYLVRKYGVRAVYWSATRGEGGQNRLNAYREEALGVYRTWESLAARAEDGGECLYGPFYDFGYSKSGQEALDRWGRTSVVREIVRAIRLVRPDVVVARWRGTPGDFHGQHQAVGLAAPEAFEAAGDPEQFPELKAQGLAAWQPLKFYQSLDNSGGDLSAGGALNLFGRLNPAFEREGVLRVNTGEFDPLAGRSYQEQAWIAFNKHLSQGMGLAPAPGDFFYYFSLCKSLVVVPEREAGIFDGLDPSLTGLYHHGGKHSPALRNLELVKTTVEEALRRFRADEPEAVAGLLLEARCLLEQTRAGLARERWGDEAQQAIDAYLARRIADVEQVAARCLGLELECLSDRARLIPGQRFRMSARLWNHRGAGIDQVTFTPRLPHGWEARPVQPDKPDGHPLRRDAAFDVEAAATADLSCPYWLAGRRAAYAYHWPEGEAGGLPFGPADARIDCEVGIGRHRFTLQAAAVRREAFPGGFRELPLAVVPPISLHPETGHAFLQARETKRGRAVRSRQELAGLLEFLEDSSTDQQLELAVVARNNSDRSIEGSLTPAVPADWKVTPERTDLCLAKPGDARTLRFTVTVPASTSEGQYSLRYAISYGGRDYAVVARPVRMAAPALAERTDASNCIREEFIISPSEVAIHVVDARFAPGLRCAYVQGDREALIDAVKPFGVDFHLITDAEMGHLDLSIFDVVVVGPRAYLLRDELRNQASRLLEYVQQGGTLVVQYQGYLYQNSGLAPYPIRYNQPHDRVTRPDAPVKILDPEHVLFRSPNRIRPQDFDHWVRERGLYFLGEWDQQYQSLLSCSDPGEEPREGGLVMSSVGRGTYLYAGYSFFRQLPAGVPGAFRLFANILGLPAARILERIESLKKTALFSSLTEEQLEAVARHMSTRWVKSGTYLCREGDPGDELYIVHIGEVEVLRESNGRHSIIEVAGAGACIGELAVLRDSVRTASMRARGDVSLLVIDRAACQALLRQQPDVSVRLLHILADRLANTTRSWIP
jgi:LmbE family N-acetylglucosaminyl deacetylase